MLAAIIVAGGNSERMGFDKMFALLAGQPVVACAIDAFQQTDAVTEIIIVGRKDRLDDLKEIARPRPKVRGVVAGGQRRQDSVFAGLSGLGPGSEYVAVHDAARPLITSGEIERVFEACRTHEAAALAEPVTDTLKRATKDLVVCGGVEREGLYAMQTPQIFRRRLLLEAYQAASQNNALLSDEVSAIELLGKKVVIVPNGEFNLKITYPRDLALAELILSRRRDA